MTAPGSIEIDCSGPEPLVSIEHPPGPFTASQLRLYAGYLATLADEAGRRPEVDELVAVFAATHARWLPYDEAAKVMACAALDAGYDRKNAATGTGG